ncbi:MAG TPA: hypothetical protein VLK35_04580 [Methylomirabilota bacterium]|nr:hypothetical protein [Methylomirabilota bacterium]
MKHRTALLLAILLYVTLDLSLPTMPGAFVFEPADSVESTYARARTVVEIVVLPTPTPDALVLSRPPVDVKDRLVPSVSAERARRPVLAWRSRALHDPAPPSEDPH